jgi:Enoyl-(Acyl carrier protein) reductase
VQRRIEWHAGEAVGVSERVEERTGDERVANAAGGEFQGRACVLDPDVWPDGDSGTLGALGELPARWVLVAPAGFVNAICPGPVRSPMSAQEGDASVDITPRRRRAEPEEISSAVAFLASDDAVYITGAELAVDGGYLAR